VFLFVHLYKNQPLQLKRIALVILLVLTVNTIKSQTKGLLFFSDSNLERICFKSNQKLDSSGIIAAFHQCLNEYHQQGYLEARVDSIASDATILKAHAFLGSRYRWTKLVSDSLSNYWFSSSGVKIEDFVGEPIRPFQLQQVSSKTLKHLEQIGFPFARVEITSASIQDSLLNAKISVVSGPRIILDTLYIKGSVSVSRRFIESLLGFRSGKLYNESDLQKYDSKIAKTGFLKIVRPTEVEFIPGKARIYTYLENRKTSQFSGFVGFSSDPNSNPSLKLTGDVNLNLINSFKQGETNTLKWQALSEGSQRLNFSSSWPYLFGSSIGLTSRFKMHRSDTLFININPQVEANFELGNDFGIGLGFDYRSSLATSTVANLNSVKNALYKVALSFRSKPLNPFERKIFWASAEVGVGSRQVIISTQSGNNKSVVGEVRFDSQGNFPLFSQRLALGLKVKGEALIHLQSQGAIIRFMDNEIYRIGGYGSLRGFAEETIFTKNYAVATLELQYKIASSMNFYVFFDQASVVGYGSNFEKQIWPFGTGFGIHLFSVGGEIDIIYALGSGLGQNLALKDSKIHIGYTAYF
jgi:outer membrane protein assembly factor BamA